MANEAQLARALGWFSIGLGLSQVIAPHTIAQFVGTSGDDDSTATMRLIGLRELACGVNILTQPEPTGWLWARVAGDAMDLALLGTALPSDKSQHSRVAAVTAAVAGITALDLRASQEMSRHSDGQQANHHRNGLANGAHVSQGIRVKKAITINRAADELYRFWHNFENLPCFMHHLESVQVTGERRSHWKAKALAGKSVEWDAETTDDRPNELIAWRSVENADVPNRGVVRFVPAPGNRGTEVHVELAYDPPGGPIGAAIAKLFGEEPGQQVGDDLRAFKQVMETGEVVYSDASIYGRPHPAQPPDFPVNQRGEGQSGRA